MEGGRGQLGFATLILVALGAALALAGPGPAPATSAPERPPELGSAELARISVAVDAAGRAAGRAAARAASSERLPKPEVVKSEFLNRLGRREATRVARAGSGSPPTTRSGGSPACSAPARTSTRPTSPPATSPRRPTTRRRSGSTSSPTPWSRTAPWSSSCSPTSSTTRSRTSTSGSQRTPRLDDDGALAETALVEGSATAVMTEFAARHLDPVSSCWRRPTGSTTGTGDVPKAYVDQLTWAYLGGMRFVDALRELGGQLEAGRLRARSRPPASTEQVLHPRKYVHDERPARRCGSTPRRCAPTAGGPRIAASSASCATSLLLGLGAVRDGGRGRGGGLGRRPLRALAARPRPRRVRVPVPVRPRPGREVELRHRRRRARVRAHRDRIPARAGSTPSRPATAPGGSRAATSRSPAATARRRSSSPPRASSRRERHGRRPRADLGRSPA